MWSCPKCKRKFKNSNQWHTCKSIEVKSIFAAKPSYLFELYEMIRIELKNIGTFNIEAVPPNLIMYKSKSTFLAIKAKSKWLEIEFFLNVPEDVPPVKKFLKTSKNRVVHTVAIDEPADIDTQLIDWMRRSYLLISNS